MGKFDGILLATDWDGTIYYNSEVSEENKQAIEYFCDNGGLFTVCSGRYFKFLKGFKDAVKINTYVICYNGAFIIDLDTEEILYQGFCDEYLFSILGRLSEANVNYQTINFYDPLHEEPTQYTKDSYKDIEQSIKDKQFYKVLFRFETPEDALFALDITKKIDMKSYIAVRSWDRSLELLMLKNSKGVALRRVMEKTGSKLLVAVGDYENDIEMLKHADIGYAVGNATDSLKAMADRITVHASESAIARVIYDLDKELEKD